MRAASVFLLLLLSCASSSTTGTGGGVGGGSGGSGGGTALKCGNGTLETDEVCENLELRNKTCVTEGFTTGTVKCSATCTLDLGGCSKCGDGLISGLEKCDGTAFGGKTCAGLVDAGAFGDLGCADSCSRIDTTGCRFLPTRNLPCTITTGCAPPFVCDIDDAFLFRCRLHCDQAAIGTSAGCPAGEQCRDGGLEIEGATAMPPAFVMCSAAGCGAGYACADAGTSVSFCGKRTGTCQ